MLGTQGDRCFTTDREQHFAISKRLRPRKSRWGQRTTIGGLNLEVTGDFADQEIERNRQDSVGSQALALRRGGSGGGRSL
jgi:hypothetical protein